MADETATEMDALAIDSFLESQHTGVLTMAKADDAYGVPLSFTYDDEDRAIYLRLGFAPGSQKRQYLDATDHVTFVVYEDTEAGWKSVVFEGKLEYVTDEDVDATVVEAMKGLDIPYFKVHERPATDVQFDVARIQPTKVSGIVAGDSGG